MGQVDGDAEDPPEGSLLHKLLYGSFQGDPDIDDKIRLVGELAGAAMAGCMRRLRQKKSFILKGQSADNGKSQILDLLRSMLPEAAVGAVPPNKFSDERQIIHLRGKLLNARDELTSAQVIASDIYKSVITGEPVSGRDVYRAAIAFRSNALHVFATNVLPSYSGGFDKGVRRRQGMLVFNRVIPVEQQIRSRPPHRRRGNRSAAGFCGGRGVPPVAAKGVYRATLVSRRIARMVYLGRCGRGLSAGQGA